MSNRILRESICTSPSLEGLTWFEEVCFYRLIVQCDDFGRMDGRVLVLKSRLFPLREDVDTAMLQTAIQRLAQADLVVLYERDGFPYLQLKTWDVHQRVRNRRSKYPSPFDDVPPSADD